MALIDRYTRSALGLASFQLLVLFGLLVYGLASPSLGTRMLLPGLAIVVTHGALIWMTLHRPWDWSFGTGGGEGWLRGHAYVWDPGLIIGTTLYVAHLHSGVLESAKDTLRKYAAAEGLDRFTLRETIAVWDADTFGALIVSGPGVVVVFIVPALVLGIVWLFLPH